MTDADTPRPARELPDVSSTQAEAETMGRGEVVRASSPAMTGAQRRHLRALGHHRQVTVHVGQQGLTPALLDRLEQELEHHELVKVKVLEGAPIDTRTAALWFHRAAGASVPQLLGRTLLVYRPHPEEPEITLPRARGSAP